MHAESEIDFKAVGQRVLMIRNNARLSRDDFGSRIGVGGKHVRNIEKGVRRLSPEVAFNICREFPEYSMDYLFRGVPVDRTDNLYVRISRLPEAKRDFALNILDSIEKQDMD
ncbi:helix-turn-helix transcriptional regulator [Lactimicrobium massiliense]|uniref:helix-turn-helix transcriptional regulator n=1 Tax=Lactimicrobium massiliense TaxID=2161814 RepID=UPI000D550C15|nr:helix-turn-helix transcriptional regulator [Lactimicrobium massiliense]